MTPDPTADSTADPETPDVRPESGDATAADTGADAMDRAEMDAILLDLGLADETLDAIPDDAAAMIVRAVLDRRDADDARLRALADFRNFQRRSIENEGRARRDGLASLVRGLLPVIEHFDLALQSAASATTVEQLVQGVKMVRGELDRALESNGVATITADAGADFEPGRHEALGMMPPGQSPEDAAPGSIAITVAPGFAIGELILRPAKVMLVPEASG